jgi:hypothetical protein
MKLSKNNIINLEDFRTTGAKIFTGRDRGKSVRIDSNINSIEEKFDSVIIIIPENIYSIIPSFLEEFLHDVVMKLGREGFMSKFTIKSEGNYNPDRALNEAIERILRNKTAIE